MYAVEYTMKPVGSFLLQLKIHHKLCMVYVVPFRLYIDLMFLLQCMICDQIVSLGAITLDT